MRAAAGDGDDHSTFCPGSFGDPVDSLPRPDMFECVDGRRLIVTEFAWCDDADRCAAPSTRRAVSNDRCLSD